MGRSWIALLGFTALGGATPATPAGPIELGLPVDCTIGERCLVQKLFDHDPTSARLDYRCGMLTTDGHDGIDLRVRTMTDMAAGVPVVAAANGTVLRVRDGEPDINVRLRGDINGRDAGNGVVIDHGNGWETQYSHLRRGSVRVKPGEPIQAGQQIGLIGMSGNAEFPHLHFALRFEGQPVDPFTGPLKSGTCMQKDAGVGSLWTRSAARALGYRPSAVIATSLASSVPPASVSDRLVTVGSPAPSDALILWADVFGLMSGDTQRFQIVGPDGNVVFEQSNRLDRGALSWFAYAGRRAPAEGWPKGRYSGNYELIRSGAVVARGHSEATIQ
jgi:hypothetical protein